MTKWTHPDLPMVLQYLCNSGPCRDPLNLLAWRFAPSGLPTSIPGARVECAIASKNSVNGHVVKATLDTTPT